MFGYRIKGDTGEPFLAFSDPVKLPGVYEPENESVQVFGAFLDIEYIYSKFLYFTTWETYLLVPLLCWHRV